MIVSLFPVNAIWVNSYDYFTLTINPTTGEVTLALLDNVWHGDTTDVHIPTHGDRSITFMPITQ